MKKHGNEVRNMLYAEWNMEDACRAAAEKAREQALKESLEKGLKRGIIKGEVIGIQKSIRMLKDVLPPEIKYLPKNFSCL